MLRFLTTLVLCLQLTGCGVKGALQPKGVPEPEAPASLTLKQQGETVLLRWSIPTLNQDGSTLTDLAGFRIDLYSYTPSQFCPECKDQETVATIAVEQPQPATMANGYTYLRIPHPGAGQGARYRITPYTANGKSGPFAEVRQIITNAPAAPQDIKATALDRGVNLLWSLPEGIQDRGELLGINIYRGEEMSGLAPEPINNEPVKGNNFDDFGLENNRTYQYGLRSVVRIGQFTVESGLSEIATTTPQAGL